MKCPVCKTHIDPKLDIRSLLAVIAITLLVGILGGLFLYHEFLIPQYDRQIKKDGEIKKELRDNYVPNRPEIKKIK